jgi:hypothetical protein
VFVKAYPEMIGTWVSKLGGEDPLWVWVISSMRLEAQKEKKLTGGSLYLQLLDPLSSVFCLFVLFFSAAAVAYGHQTPGFEWGLAQRLSGAHRPSASVSCLFGHYRSEVSLALQLALWDYITSNGISQCNYFLINIYTFCILCSSENPWLLQL